MKYCIKCGSEVSESMNYCPKCGADLNIVREEYSVSSEGLIGKIKDIIREGNATRIIVKNEKGETIFEIPLTIGIVGSIIAPWMAALGVIAALVSKCTIVVEKKK